MAAAIPLVEVTHDTHSYGVRRPDNEVDTGDTLNGQNMRAHGLIGFEEGSLGEEMQLIVGEERRKCIGIMALRNLSCTIGDAETIGSGFEGYRDNGFKEAGIMEAHHRNRL
jgi:hypothetical protein